MKVIFGTTNERKVHDLKNIVKQNNWDIEMLSMADIGWDEGEIEENGSTIQENSLIKASAIFNFCARKGIKHPIITDDSGLFIDAIGGLPGIYTARFADEEMELDPTLPKHESANKILRLMQNKTDRSAKFHCCVTLMNPDGSYSQLIETTNGTILNDIREPIKAPWTYCIFSVEDTGKTLHELSGKELTQTYRHKALEKTLGSLGAPQKPAEQGQLGE
jgi:XTP/dITP diphosphohydrolase